MSTVCSRLVLRKATRSSPVRTISAKPPRRRPGKAVTPAAVDRCHASHIPKGSTVAGQPALAEVNRSALIARDRVVKDDARSIGDLGLHYRCGIVGTTQV